MLNETTKQREHIQRQGSSLWGTYRGRCSMICFRAGKKYLKPSQGWPERRRQLENKIEKGHPSGETPES